MYKNGELCKLVFENSILVGLLLLQQLYTEHADHLVDYVTVMIAVVAVHVVVQLHQMTRNCVQSTPVYGIPVRYHIAAHCFGR